MSTTQRVRNGWAALQQSLTQRVETVTTSPTLFTGQREIDVVDLAENAADHWENYESTPLVRASIDKFASDVVEPGYRLEGDDESAVEYLTDTWLPQAAVIAGEKHNDFLPFLKLGVKQRWARGGLLAEKLKDDPTSSEFDLTGLKYVKPETVKAQTHENTNVLIEPDETDLENVTLTPRREAAAYVQWDDEAPIGPFNEKDEVPLSQNDVVRSVLDPDIGETWGNPVTATIDDDLTGFKNILRDQEKAIKTKAYGVWSVAFGRDTIEGPDFFEVIEWSDDDQDDFVENEIKNLGPGEIVGHDGEIELQKFEPDVPELIGHLEFYVNNITTALPSPKYVVGFERDINQFVTARQDERYEKLISEEREELERTFTALLKDVVERNRGIEDPDVSLVIEPEPEASPIMSLDGNDVERIETYATALDTLAGPTQGPGTLVDDDTLRELIAQLPEDAMPTDERPVDETDGNVEAQFEAFLENLEGEDEGEDEEETDE